MKLFWQPTVKRTGYGLVLCNWGKEKALRFLFGSKGFLELSIRSK